MVKFERIDTASFVSIKRAADRGDYQVASEPVIE